MADKSTSKFNLASPSVPVLGVVVAVLISVLSFRYTQQKEAAAREAQIRKFLLQERQEHMKDTAQRQQIEAAALAAERRHTRYREAKQAAAVLSSPGAHTPAETAKARKRFWELYWAELSREEGARATPALIKLGQSLEPNLRPTPKEVAAYNQAHGLRASLRDSWGLSDRKTGKATP